MPFSHFPSSSSSLLPLCELLIFSLHFKREARKPAVDIMTLKMSLSNIFFYSYRGHLDEKLIHKTYN